MMTVFELRVALTATNYDSLVVFYWYGLGLEPGDTWNDHGRGQLFHSGKAVIEILDKEHANHVDTIGTGQAHSGPIRFAFQVLDIHSAVEKVRQYGATSRDFYTNVLAFDEVSYQPDSYSVFHKGNVQIALQAWSQLPDDHSLKLQEHRRVGLGVEIVIEVDDHLAERPWGSRGFKVIDPNGYNLWINGLT